MSYESDAIIDAYIDCLVGDEVEQEAIDREARRNAETWPPPPNDTDSHDSDDIGLVDQWPKQCGCGRMYTAHEWKLLQYVGAMVEVSLELRNCADCHSTLAQKIESA